MKTIDLNCDLGESFGPFTVGNDEQIIPYVTSINVACGFHAGDPSVMEKTIQLAKKYNVAIGAHPGYQDLSHFGRRHIPTTPRETYQLVLYQLGALSAFCRANDVGLHHVKPHGALYNVAANDKNIASAIASAVKDFDETLLLYGLSNSELILAGDAAGLQTVSEVFADRTYEKNGTLTPRTMEGSVIHNPNEAIEQVRQMVLDGEVTSRLGTVIKIKADTICLHGDNEQALSFAKELHHFLQNEGIQLQRVEKVKR